MEKRLLEAINDCAYENFDSIDTALKSYSNRVLLDLFLEYEGIRGYTNVILSAMKALGFVVDEPAQTGQCHHVDGNGNSVGVTIAGAKIDPHEYELEEDVKGCTVRVLHCKKCGHVVVGWKRDDGSERIDEI